MPIYEFRCETCGARFEALVAAGSASETCRECGSAGAPRVWSRPAEAVRLLRTGADKRRQEDRNRVLRDATRRQFSERRRAASEAARARGRGGAAG